MVDYGAVDVAAAYVEEAGVATNSTKAGDGRVWGWEAPKGVAYSAFPSSPQTQGLDGDVGLDVDAVSGIEAEGRHGSVKARVRHVSGERRRKAPPFPSVVRRIATRRVASIASRPNAAGGDR